MPPSSNHQYWARGYTCKKTGKVKGIMTQDRELIAFKKYIADWHLENDKQVREARFFILDILSRKNMVRWDTYLCWQKEKLWDQDGKPKRNDIDDRLKAVRDCISQILGFDDKCIFAGYEEKMKIAVPKPFCFIVLSEHKPRDLSEYKWGEVPR